MRVPEGFDGAALVLRTPRLVLRPARVGDAERLWPHVSDPELARSMTWSAHRDLEETRNYLSGMVDARESGRTITWCAFLGGEEGELCAYVGIEGVLRRVRAVEMHRAELGYWVAASHRGLGIATEASGAAVGYAFEGLGLNKVVVSHRADNPASRRVIEKLGFRFVGTAREEIRRDGRWCDVLRYEMLASEFSAARSRG